MFLEVRPCFCEGSSHIYAIGKSGILKNLENFRDVIVFDFDYI